MQRVMSFKYRKSKGKLFLIRKTSKFSKKRLKRSKKYKKYRSSPFLQRYKFHAVPSDGRCSYWCVFYAAHPEYQNPELKQLFQFVASLHLPSERKREANNLLSSGCWTNSFAGDPTFLLEHSTEANSMLLQNGYTHYASVVDRSAKHQRVVRALQENDLSDLHVNGVWSLKSREFTPQLQFSPTERIVCFCNSGGHWELVLPV